MEIREDSSNRRKFYIFQKFFKDNLEQIYDKLNLKSRKITYNNFVHFAYFTSTVDYKLIDIYSRYI